MTISTKHITVLFLNFLFTVGVIVAVIGFIRTLQFSANLLFLPEYPLNQYEDSCLTDAYYSKPVVAPDQVATQDAATMGSNRQLCQDRLVKQRQNRKVSDATMAIGMLVSGVVLAVVFNPRKPFLNLDS